MSWMFYTRPKLKTLSSSLQENTLLVISVCKLKTKAYGLLDHYKVSCGQEFRARVLSWL